MECFVLVTVGWVFSVCLHEFAHAWVAKRGGDYTVEEKGYLTLNPFRYADPVYTVVLPLVFVVLGGIGLPGAAVYINRELLRSKWWDMGVSLAGPAVNLFLILVLATTFHLGFIPKDPANLFSYSLAFLLFLEISALILNLLPIPPLDGFQAIAPWLPVPLRERAFKFAGPAQLILFVVLWNDNFVRHYFWSAIFGLTDVAGVDPLLVRNGYEAFKFWRRE